MLWGLLLPSLLVAEPDGLLSTPPVPPAPPAPERAGRTPGTPEILFVNFDGAVLQTGCGNNPHYDCSTLAHLFDGYIGPFTGNLQQKWGVIQATRKDLAPFGVTVVTNRPPDDVEYTMVIYGDIGPQSFAGVAPYIDCEDRWGGDTSFSGNFTTSNSGSTIILQEAAHTWGLEHVNSETDILNPFKTSNKDQTFEDECFPIVANTSLESAGGSCNQMHVRFCTLPGFQNSWQEMFYLFGPPVPDVDAPNIEIRLPEQDGVYIAPTTVPLTVHIEDDRHPQPYTFTVTLEHPGGTQTYSPEKATLYLDNLVTVVEFNQVIEGDYRITFEIADEAGNTTSDSVSFTVLPEGSELPTDDGGTTLDEEGMSCAIGGPAPISALAALLLPCLASRRRRR